MFIDRLLFIRHYKPTTCIHSCDPHSPLWGRCYCYSYLAGKEVETQRSEVPCAWSCSKRYRARFHPRQSGSRDILLTTVPHDFSMCNLSSHNTLEDNVLDILRIRKSKLSNLPEELIPKYLPSLPPTVVTLKDSSAMGPRAMTGIRGCWLLKRVSLIPWSLAELQMVEIANGLSSGYVQCRVIPKFQDSVGMQVMHTRSGKTER